MNLTVYRQGIVLYKLFIFFCFFFNKNLSYFYEIKNCTSNFEYGTLALEDKAANIEFIYH